MSSMSLTSGPAAPSVVALVSSEAATARAAEAAAVVTAGTNADTKIATAMAPLSSTYPLGVVAKTDAKGGRMPPATRVPQLVVERAFPNRNAVITPAWASGMTAYGVSPRSWSIYKTTDGGKSWTRKSTADQTYTLNARGMFLKTTANTLLSVEASTPTAPTIRRSTDDGVTWSAAVYTFRTNTHGLAPTSWAQDPNTGRIYLAEYQTVDSLTTVLILKSDDDGLTWSTFHTFPSLGDAANPLRVRHVHTCEWDPVDQRMYFTVGDSEAKSGIYRVNAGLTDVESVLTNDQTGALHQGQTFGLMFFPTHIAWVTDDPRARLVRMARTEIGQATPIITEMYWANGCGWTTMRVAADNTGWIAFTNAETSTTPLDPAGHTYYVTDNGATFYEIGTIGGSGQQYIGLVPVGGALLHDASNLWAATNWNIFDNDQQNMIAVRATLAFGSGQVIAPLTHDRPDFTAPVTISSGVVALAISQTQIFFEVTVPPNMARIYIVDWGVLRLSGTGAVTLKVTRMDTTATLLVQGGSANPILSRSNGRQGDPFYTSALVPAGTKIRFEVDETGGIATAVANAFVTYALSI